MAYKRAGDLLKEDLLALPGVVAAGASREMVAAAVAGKGTVPAPVPKAAWWLDAIQVGVGLGLRAVDYIWGVPAVGELAEGVLYPGLAYAAEDVTHDVVRAMRSGQSGSTKSHRAQVPVLSAPAPAPAPQRPAVRLAEDF